MRALPVALFLAFATWIVGCAAPDVVGSRTRGGDVADDSAGDDDDEPTPPKKKSTPSNGQAPVEATTTDAVVTPPTTTTTTTTTPETIPTTPAPTPEPPAPEPTPTPVATPTKFVTTANLNLRTGPSTADTIILTMPKGSEIEAVKEEPTNGWYLVAYQGQEGWASGSYLQEN